MERRLSVADPQITDNDVIYLGACEKQPFYPIGWLYTNVFESLRDRGLVFLDARGYSPTAAGRDVLAKVAKK
jgi:hypothetical protein